MSRCRIWKAASNALFTNSRRLRLGLTDNGTCPLCTHKEETVEHLLFSCEFTRALFHAASLPLPPNPLPLVADGLLFWLNPKPPWDVLTTSKCLNLAWCIWKGKCDLIFHNVNPNPSFIAFKASSLLTDPLSTATHDDPSFSNPPPSPHPPLTHPSTPITIHCDVGIRGNLGMWGFVCRKNGNLFLIATCYINTVEAAEAELKCALEAIKWAAQSTDSMVLIRSDCLSVVNWFNSLMRTFLWSSCTWSMKEDTFSIGTLTFILVLSVESLTVKHISLPQLPFPFRCLGVEFRCHPTSSL